MSKKIYISATNCITPLGFDVRTNMEKLRRGQSGILKHQCGPNGSVYAARIPEEMLNTEISKMGLAAHYTKMEKLLILALNPVVAAAGLTDFTRVGLIVSTTKGNIDALEQKRPVGEAHLFKLAQTVAGHFRFKNEPLVVSNACVSGILAVAVAKRLIQAGQYDKIFVVSGDLVSEFVLSGFNSFQALSDAPCKPYSLHRNGVTLGEAAAAVLVESSPADAKVQILGDGAVNDANHISGPSRTGEGLYLSIQKALTESGIDKDSINYISAHGTATPFNDEMEAIAFNRIGLGHVPLNSLKGYYGHTLGASGLLETVIGIESMQRGELISSAGFDELGVSQPLNIITTNLKQPVRRMLKTASGFGGCNTAVLFEKV